ncbi:MAG TPA: hypothetical protein VEL75_17160 [Candidatus Methylomirabilis sp.]|nr:hypothetical protein [Candidatus Methylomirabilis sp.]
MAPSSTVPHLRVLPAPGEPDKHPAKFADDAFTNLPPAEQRIAQALYQAQTAVHDAGSSWAEPGARAHSLDQIAGMDRATGGWNRVFKALKAEGLITEQTLGHVVARWTRSRGVATSLRARIRVDPSPVPSRTE